MRKPLMIGLTALTAAFLLATAVSTAGAARLSSSSSTFRVAWRELAFNSGSLICEVTLEGSFHSRSIVKRRGTLIGLITRATVRHPCQVEEMWMDNGIERPLGGATTQTLPWHLTYEGFRGTLPRIEHLLVLLRGASFVVRTAGGLCLGRYGRAEDNIIGTIARNTTTGALTTLEPAEGSNIARLRERLGGIFCPAEATLAGLGTVTQLGSSTAITVTLI